MSESYTGVQKAAILLITLGPEKAATIFKHLKEDEIEELTLEIANTRSVSPQTKEEILDAIISRLTRQLLEKAKKLIEKKNVPLSQQLTLIMLKLNVSCGNFNHKILEQVHKPQNALMHQKIQAHLLSELTPLISTLIKEGIAQGIYQTDYPEEVAEMLFLYANTIFDDLTEHSEEEKQKKTAAFVFNLERLLKMEQGSIKTIVDSIFQNIENDT